MTIKSFLFSIVLIVMLLLPCAWHSLANAEEYKISMLPKFYPDKLTAMITPLAEYLSAETGHDIIPVLTDNYDQYERKILAG